MSDLVGNPEDRFSLVAAHMHLEFGGYRCAPDLVLSRFVNNANKLRFLFNYC